MCGYKAVSKSSAMARWSTRVDSNKVMALAMLRRCTDALPFCKPCNTSFAVGKLLTTFTRWI